MKAWFTKKPATAGKPPSASETGIPVATLNWFIHVLINNVGFNKWVKMTKGEQEQYDKQHPHNKGYPYKVVTSPIPKGKDIILKDSTTHTIRCDSEFTRNLIIEMARGYDKLEKENAYLQRENAAKQWHEVKELPPISPASSIRGPRIFFVSSPELCYGNGGTSLGMESEGKWFVFLNGKKIQHKVTHYRLLPPRPQFDVPEYTTVQAEVERLKQASE